MSRKFAAADMGSTIRITANKSLIGVKRNLSYRNEHRIILPFFSVLGYDTWIEPIHAQYASLWNYHESLLEHSDIPNSLRNILHR